VLREIKQWNSRYLRKLEHHTNAVAVNLLAQGSPNYGPRCDFIRPAKEQIIITASIVLITIFALKTTYAQFCSNCLLSLIYDNLFSRILYLVYEMYYFQ
jgi:hypothetical protein